MRVPRYGIHDGIKYNKKRTLVRFCLKCGKLIDNKNKYCYVCKRNNELESKRKYESKRKERKEYKRELAKKLREENRIKDKKGLGTSDSIGKVKKDMTKKDWMAYHNTIKKQMQKDMGGYQDYHDLDEYEDEYYPETSDY
jgi:DNA-directed RNA polymerase subunit M/transcription elongation factor TFIIS